jgi:outer membrane lipoprotein-sorting protein
MRREYPSSRMVRFGFGVLCAVALVTGVPGPARADDGRAMVADAHRMAQARSFKMHVVEQSPLGKSFKDIVYVAPDKVRVALGDTGLIVVVIGNDVWLRGADAKWTKAKLPPEQNPLTTVRDTTAFADNLAGKTVKALGSQQLDGVATHLYRIDVTGKAGYSVKSTRVWIGAVDGQTHKIEERNGPFVATTTYSDWNAPLSVTPQ